MSMAVALRIGTVVILVVGLSLCLWFLLLMAFCLFVRHTVVVIAVSLQVTLKAVAMASCVLTRISFHGGDSITGAGSLAVALSDNL